MFKNILKLLFSVQVSLLLLFNISLKNNYTENKTLLCNSNPLTLSEDNPSKDTVSSSLREYSEKSLEENSELKKYYDLIDEESINYLGIDSKTPYFIFVSTDDQKTYIYKKINNSWIIEKEFICATGKEGTETPIGIFEIGSKGDWFYSSKFDKGAKYYLQFNEDYLFHSTPYYPDKKTIWEDTLGEPASHGCVRLNTIDAKWMYENIPSETKVIIY
ncbi:MAG: L,D-transpeptidase [Clostridium perfringens]|nr:L,D-transpeptidase [Clostridium perfringens]